MPMDDLQGFSLSPQQERLWLLMQAGGGHWYRTDGVILLTGALDHVALSAALRDISERHEILRTVFRRLEGMSLPLQVIVEPGDGASHRHGTAAESAPEGLLAEACRSALDPVEGPPLRTSLLPLGTERHALLVSLPSLCADAATLGILLRDLAASYDHHRGGPAPESEPMQYADLAAWQRDLLESAAAEEPGAARVLPSLAGLQLPWERSPGRGPFEPRVEPVVIEAAAAGIAAVERETGLPRRALLLACWQVLLARLTGQPDLVVGVAFDGRRYEGLDRTPGLFARYLPVPARLEGQPFDELARALAADLADAGEEQELFSWRGAEEENGDVLPVLFDEVGLGPAVEAGGVSFRLEEQRSCIERFRLRLSCVEARGMLRLDLHYDAGSLSRTDVARLVEAFRVLLEDVLADPRKRVDELDVMGAVERQRLLVERNDTALALGAEICFHHRFEERAARAPQSAAVTCGDHTLAYGALNRRANQLARHLIAAGVGPDVPVALCLKRSLEMAVAILGVLKAGGAYVPLDPSYPPDRLAFMLEDSAAPILLTQSRLEGAVPRGTARSIRLDADWPAIARQDEGDLGPRALPENIAYVIYTSGSTGRPKGVMIPHRGLANYLGWCTGMYAVATGIGAPVQSSFSFDLTVTSLLAPLHAGRTAFLVPEEDGIGGLGDLLARQRGWSLLKITPAHLEILVPLLASVDLAGRAAAIVVGGEALRGEALEMWRTRAPETRILNEYGPTEAVVGCAVYEMRAGDAAPGPVPIGRPVPNARLYLLDARLQPVPGGAEGELYIGGVALARGYLRRQELTADRFLPDPFAAEPGGRMYRTGDLARWGPGGHLLFLGRADHQVKIRGYRIELGEIEAVLGEHPAVQEAIVLAREDKPGERRLVAYLLAAGAAEPASEELRGALARRLPEYMIPSAFEVVPAWPLTPNGKVDRNALSVPHEWEARQRGPWVAPRNLVEEALAAIWAEVLDVEAVGAEDNFFQLGGDSILTITVVARARERGFGLAPQDLFRFPILADLARALLAANGKVPVLVAAPPFSLLAPEDRDRLENGLEDAYPLSRLQAGMLFHSEHSRETAVYHDISSFHLRGPLNLRILEAVVEQLVQRHPALRTSFRATGFSEPLQLVHRSAKPSFRVDDLRHLAPAEQETELAAWREREKLQALDWTQPTLARFQVHVRGTDAFQLTLSYHHAIVDGWSVASLLSELFRHYTSLLRGDAYRATPLPEITYRDFVALERQAAGSAEQQDFWRDHLAGHTVLLLPRLGGPAVPERPAMRVWDVPFPPALEDAVRRLAATEGMPLKTLALAAHLKAVSVLGGQADVLTGLVSHGRPEVEGGERIAGLFLNTLPFRLDLERGSWRGLVRRVFEAELKLLPYRRYPMAEIQRLQGGKPLFATLFNFVHFHVYQGLSGLRELEPVDAVFFEETSFPFAASFSAGGSGAGLHLRLHYDGNELSDAQVEAVAGYYEAALSAMTADPESRHEQLSLITEPERRQLAGWSGSVGEVPRRLLHEAFGDSARRTPRAPALFHAGTALTYAELDRASNAWANRLRALGVGADQVVGVFAERSPEAVIAQLAILKAGGAYLPLDPAYPKARLAFMAETSRISVLLTQRSLAANFPAAVASILVVDAAEAVDAADGASAPAVAVPPEALAYVIYTSGSTGHPKGVGVTHGGLANLIAQQERLLGVGPESRVLQFASPSFDAAIWELGMAFVPGASLCLPASRAEVLPGPDLLRLLRDGGVTHATLPPSVLAALPAAELPELRTLIAAGEALPAEVVQRWAPGRRLINAYGPSEGTVCATLGEVSSAGGRPSIGRPLGNTVVHILDRYLQPAPVGVAGELHIGGPGLARGYLGRPDLTAARFVPAPSGEMPGARLYATGDLARFRADGELEFLGRIDQQVKIRGFRIELGEIEAVLIEHPGVREGAVLTREDEPGRRQLVAYAVAERPAEAPGVEELRSFLRERLPEHMLPAAFVYLDALPLSPNGKLDRRALPAPEGNRAGLRTAGAAPRTEAERVIAGIWRGALRIDQVGRNDNFFDLGGHSLHLLQIQARLREALQIDVAMVELLTHTSVSALADHLTRSALPAERPQEAAAPAASDRSSGVAVIAMAGRFPNARNVEELWGNLIEGRESITFFTPEELQEAGVPAAELADPAYVRARGILAGAEELDAGFFGVTPREAELMDPQQRIFLECAWEALERAGYLSDRETGPVGVFAGESMNSYMFNLLSNPELVEALGAFQAVTVNDKDFLATRVSYKLGLEGASLTVQTACSTSLVAVHLACQSLLNGECEIALAGGVSVRVPQRSGYVYQPGGVDSPDGHCRAFDAAAQGTVAGNGVGLVVLKRLDRARADGDPILAVIKGSAVNNDGSRKAGYTAPRVEGQARVIRSAHLAAGVDADSISYVEAHGTGTPLGDPIEVAALHEAFRASTDRRGFCALGSIKTNIGHLDAASGVAGLIKAVLALQNEAIPPSLHFERPNPQIDFAGTPFYVNAHPVAWPRGESARRAGVSSFGIGGTNVHVVLEEAPLPTPAEPSATAQILVLSARTETALERETENLARHLECHPELELADVAYTLQMGRRGFDHRRMVVCRDTTEAVALLANPDGGRLLSSVEEPRRRSVAFLFPGQGSQHVGMAADVYRLRPAFRAEVDRCAEILDPLLGLDLRAVLFPRDGGVEEAARRLAETALTQPALFTVEYSLARLWMSWGLQPEAMLGHSIGEYVSACLAGVLSLEDALALVVERGRLIQRLPQGAMLSVPLPEEEARAVAGGLDVAAVNAPDLTLLAGTPAAVEAMQAELARRGLVCRRLHTSHAFHSALMEPVVDAFRERMARVRLRPPSIPFLSNVTGTWIEDAEAVDPAYWARHLRVTVRFAEGVGELLREPDRLLLEVGPGSTLATLVRRHPARIPRQAVLSSLPHPQEPASADEFLLNAAGRVWLAGHPVEWPELHGERRRRVLLPTYPFERHRYWVEPGQNGAASLATAGHLRVPPLSERCYAPSWKRSSVSPGDRAGRPAGRAACRLVFLDESELGARLVERLERAGDRVVTVRAGVSYARLSPAEHTLDPARPEHYRALLDDLAEAPEAVTHLWSLDGSDSVERCQELGFHSLLALTQSLIARFGGEALDLQVITRGVHEVSGEEELRPAAATIQGFCRVLPQEHPGIACRCIDLDPPAPGSPAEARLLDRLAADLAPGAGNGTVAYRGGFRWEPVFDRLPWVGSDHRSPLLRQGGVYVITGGLGRVGFALARHLAREWGARLMLIGRSLPAAGRREELVALGPDLEVLAADVADREQMRRALARAEERFGTIHGVLHAAGLVGPEALRSIQEMSRADVEAQFRAKLHGTLVLADLLRERDLDFCVLISSLSVHLGGLGFSAYAAANSFLDAFARSQSRAGRTPWISVDWDGWRVADETGESPGAGAVDAITPAEGGAILDFVLSAPAAVQVAVSMTDLQERHERSLRAEPRRDQPAREAGRSSRMGLSTLYVTPRNELERHLTEIWRHLLGGEEIGVHDSFFELGGHSLLAMQLLSRLRETFQVSLSLGSIFELATVAAQAEHIARSQSADEAQPALPLVPVARTESLPLSFAQQRLWFFQQLEPDSPAYNVFVAFSLEGPLDRAALQRSLTEVVRRHEVLRTTFVAVDGTPRQVITPPAPVPLPLIDLLEIDEARQAAEAQERLGHAAQLPFDLAQGPLLRVLLVRLRDRGHVMFMGMHHIVCDAWSVGVFNRELPALYAAFTAGRPSALPEPALQYADFAVWQRRWLEGELLEAQLAYWRRQLADLSVLELPADRRRSAHQTYRGATYAAALPAPLSAPLEALCREENVTLFMLLLAAFKTLLFRYSGQEDIVVGTNVANRNRSELEDLIGFFVNNLVLRTDLSGDPTFRELLARVRGVTLGAYAHQDLPFDRLVEELQREQKRDASRHPLFQAMFVLQNTPASDLELPGLAVRPFELEGRSAVLDLLFNVYPAEQGISCVVEYNTDLFDESTIVLLCRSYEALLTHCAGDLDLEIGSVSLLLPDEDAGLWSDFNESFGMTA